MSKKTPLIPFFLTPSAWLLGGTARELAKAAHYLDGIDMEIAQATILHKGDQAETARATIAIKHAHGQLSDYDRDIELSRLETSDETALKIAALEIDARHGKITQKAADKEIATLREQPWVGILDDGYNADDGISGFFFEFDWNEFWITELRNNGYYGANDEIIMQQWFSDICRAEAAEVLPLSSGYVGAPVNETRSN